MLVEVGGGLDCGYDWFCVGGVIEEEGDVGVVVRNDLCEFMEGEVGWGIWG